MKNQKILIFAIVLLIIQSCNSRSPEDDAKYVFEVGSNVEKKIETFMDDIQKEDETLETFQKIESFVVNTRSEYLKYKEILNYYDEAEMENQNEFIKYFNEGFNEATGKDAKWKNIMSTIDKFEEEVIDLQDELEHARKYFIKKGIIVE